MLVTELWLQSKILTLGAVGFKEKPISLNGYPKPYSMVVHKPIVSRWPSRGGLDSETPALAGRALRLVAGIIGSLVRCCLLVIHS